MCDPSGGGAREASSPDTTGAARRLPIRRPASHFETAQLVAPPKQEPVVLPRSVVAPPRPVWEWKGPDTRTVALQGEPAPGTGGFDFDSQDGDAYGFGPPVVNERGDVAFAASYGHAFTLKEQTPSAGVFFWDRSEDRVSPVALPGLCIDGESVLSPLNNLLSFFGPEINDRNQISVAVENVIQALTVVKEIPFSVLLQFTPNDDRCETFSGEIIAQTGDPAPGGDEFAEFKENSENERGDIAFKAELSKSSLTAGDVAAQPVGREVGIFLYEAHEQEIVYVVRNGEPLPGTNGGRYCSDPGPSGPWMNDDRVVMFQANCVKNSSGVELPEYEGSMFLWTEEGGLRLFLKNNSPGPRVNGTCPTIREILTGNPGLSEDHAVFLLKMDDGLLSSSVIATKKLSEDDPEDHLDVCAREGQDLGRGYSLELSVPAISSDDIIGFIGRASGWECNKPAEPAVAFTCYRDDLHEILRQGDQMPVGQCNRFGEIELESLSDRYIVFRNSFPAPSGIFTANSNPQLP